MGSAVVYFSVSSAEEFDKETGQLLCGTDKLPPDLKQYVKEDNELFDNEIEEWDIQQAQRAQQEKALAISASATGSIFTSPSSSQPPSIKPTPPEIQGQANECLFFLPRAILRNNIVITCLHLKCFEVNMS